MEGLQLKPLEGHKGAGDGAFMGLINNTINYLNLVLARVVAFEGKYVYRLPPSDTD